MKAKIYKPAMFVLMVLLAVNDASFAQNIFVSVNVAPVDVSVKTKFKDKDFDVKMKDFEKDLKASLKDLGKSISLTLSDIAPKINLQLNDLGKDLDFNINPKINIDLGSGTSFSMDSEGDEKDNTKSEKFKSYTKSYPIDGNDKIKLSNQYGKIMVTTWDRHEVKVDVQIKAEANDDNYAQKLLDGVQIHDSKSGDLVSFRTDIENNNGNSWKIWNWGGNNKKHKLTINYTVYMPAKTDLDVEDSYGAIELPNMGGNVKISTSYGSATVQSLASSTNKIDGSYGSLKIGSMNGGKIDFSYGSADIDECNNLKADISYGSFKLGKLKGTGDFDLSYVGGFRIDEVASSLKKLNINTSYSGANLGLAPNSNFDFDITTSYGGFNYNDDRVTFTSKNPPDGSKHIGTTRNYKGHVGKGGSDAQVSIHTSYGGVNFE